ncbi:MAG TPA: ComEA family DNA-binding protein [Candidatus Omnitrophota bacterium]|nr:ComEA family DNA-binding protein [Candidatus Omnitrophota bacterium]
MELKGEQKLTVIGLAVAVAVGGAVYIFNHAVCPEKPSKLLDEPGKIFEKKSEASIVVHVCGAVGREGVYRLRAGDRVVDAVRMAGDAAAGADLSAVNLAEALKDGDKITVPLKPLPNIGQLSAPAIGGAKASAVPGQKVNVNTASASELDSLPGIGPATAAKIIEARPFSKLEDIMKVPRLGKSKFEKLKDRITL